MLILFLSGGIVVGYTIFSIFYLWRQNRLQEYLIYQVAKATEEAEQIRERIQSEVTREKERLQASAKVTLEDVRERISEIQQNLEYQERDLQLWEEKLGRLEQTLESRQEEILRKNEEYHQLETRLNDVRNRIHEALRERSEVNIKEMRDSLLDELKELITIESELYCTRYLETIHHYAEHMGARILSAGIQRYSIIYPFESHSTTIALSDKEIAKRLEPDGEIANLFQSSLEVQILLEKDPLAASVYSTDGYRREIARRVLDIAVEKHCFELEEVQKILLESQRQIEEEIAEAGREAAALFGISLSSEIAKFLGRLKYRTSFGQNVLIHSIEVAHLASLLAMELGLDSKIACCAGLLHDIGKAVDQEKQGGHAEIGGDILKEFYTQPEILEGVIRHHEDVQEATPYATIISAADAISASRPGARRETFEIYIKRLETLEAIAQKISGVTTAFAISAGRELRVMVNPHKISDAEAGQVAKKIAQEIEQELHYPGQIKITVIREMKTEQYTR